MRLILLLLLIISLGGCDAPPAIPMTPPLFNKGDKVKVSLGEAVPPTIGIVFEVHRIQNPNSMSSGFRGWKYRIMFPDIILDYTEDQLTIYEKMKWSDDKAPTSPPPKAPTK